MKRPLTAAEERVIVGKGTEAPFSGRFVNHAAPGVYTCRRCGAALYRAADKFDAGCGWPAFDDEIKGSVKRAVDADGRRTEILCANCHGHLGHVFTGERFTVRDTRHCVNSISLDFIAATTLADHFERAYFGGGCFWGVEYFMWQATGVIAATSGFMGGAVDDPTYREVCRGTTGHAEVVEVLFDPKLTAYATLARLFFEIHDPTQLNRQGPDIGPQYRSVIFTTSAAQENCIYELLAQLRERGYSIVTQIAPATDFWPADATHQRYYSRKGTTPYCHHIVKRFDNESQQF